MLVLSRRLGEVIRIADNISITVVEIDQGRIRLGISAPKEVPIYRQEIWDNIMAAKGGDEKNATDART